MRYREVVTFDHHGKEKRVTVEFGVVPVRLPDILKRGRRWRGFDPVEANKEEEASLFAFFGMNTG